jgi:hypothetical protein
MVQGYPVRVIDREGGYRSKRMEELGSEAGPVAVGPANGVRVLYRLAIGAALGLYAVLGIIGCGSEPSPPKVYGPAAVQTDSIQKGQENRQPMAQPPGAKRFNIFDMDREPLRLGDIDLQNDENLKRALKNWNGSNSKPIDKQDYQY